MAVNICDYLEYDGKKYSKAIFREKVLKGEIVLNKPQLDSRIESDPDLSAWDMGTLNGKKEADHRKEIDNIIVNYPNQKIGGAESFNAMCERALSKFDHLLKTAPDNSVVVTSSSIIKADQQWIQEGKPEDYHISGKEYIKEHTETGEVEKVDSVNGTLWLVRHGQVKDGVDGNLRSKDTQLTQKGIDQATFAGKELSKIDIPKIYSGDLDRTLHTAQLIAEQQKSNSGLTSAQFTPTDTSNFGLTQTHFTPTSSGSDQVPHTFEGIVGKIAADKERIKLKDDVIIEGPLKGQRMHTWVDIVNKKPFAKSITETIHQKLAKKNEEQKDLESLSLAQNGTDAHKLLEDHTNQFVNPDGTFNDNPIINNNIRPAFKEPTQFLTDFLKECKTQDPNARVFTEAVIGKRDYSVAGAIDLIVIFSDLSYKKLDWKFIRKLGYNGVDAKRREEFEKQANLQAKILQSDYGLFDRRLDYMVPMRIHGDFSKTQTNPDGSPKFILTTIDASPWNVAKLPADKRALEPVIIHYAESDTDSLMTIYNKLHNVSKLIMELAEKGTKEQKTKARDRYNSLIKVANDIIFRQDIMSLTQEIESECALFKHLLEQNKLDKLFHNIHILEAYNETSMLSSIRQEDLIKQIDETKDPEKKKILEGRMTAYQAAMGKAQTLIKAITDYSKQYREQLSAQAGLGDASKAELELGFGQEKMLRTSMMQMKTLQLARLARIQAARNSDILKEEISKEFAKAIEQVTKEVKGNNIQTFEKHLLRRTSVGNLRIISSFKASQTDDAENFWMQKKKASNARNLDWFKENTIFNEERYKKDLAFLTDDWDNSVKIGQRTKAQRDKAISDFKDTFNIGKGFINENAIAQEKNNNFGNPYLIGNEKWYSDEFKYLLSVPALKNLYDAMISFNGKLAEAGIIEESQIYSFYPSVETSFADAWKQGHGQWDWIERLLDSVSIETSMATGGIRVDPLKNEEWKEVKAGHITPLRDPSKQSLDIGRVYTIMAEQYANVVELKQLEPMFEKLLLAEANQDVKQTNSFGNPTGKDIKNVKNIALAKAMMDYMLYGKKEGSMGVSPKLLRKALNAVGLADKSISNQKLFEAFIMWNSLVRMGFSPSTIASNIIGGTGMLAFLAKQGVMFDTAQFNKAIYYVNSNNKKAKAAVEYFNARTRSHLQHHLEKQATSTGISISPTDAAYFLMEKGDEKVQDIALIAMMQSSFITDDGQIQNIKQHLLRHVDELELTSQDIEKKAKEMSKTHSLWETMQLDKDGHPFWLSKDGSKIDLEAILDGKLTSPATSFGGAVKEVVSQVLGNADTNNIMGANLVPGIKAIFEFRNWMFGTGEGLFGGLKFDPVSDIYREGRIRVLSRALGSNFFNTISILLKGFGGNKFAPSIKEAAKEDYQKQKQKWEEKTGTPFNENEEEHLHRYIGSIQANGRHLMLLVAFALVIAALKPTKNESKQAIARDIYFNRYLKKFMNEFSFWVDPREAQSLFSNTIPAMGLLVDMMKFLGATEAEIQGLITGNENMVKHTYPLKRGLELFPLTKPVIDATALFWTQDMRDHWGMYKNTGNVSYY